MTTTSDITPHGVGAEAAVTGARGRFANADGKNPWHKLWQIPLLIAGIAVFALGLRVLVKAIKPIPFGVHVADVRKMLEAGQYTQAIDRVNDLVNYFKEPLQVAELEALAGDAHYLFEVKAEAGGSALSRENWQAVRDHYEKAVTYGAKPSPIMNQRWGEAALKLGDAKHGIEKFEDAEHQQPGAMDEHARELVAAYLADKDVKNAQHMLQRFLKTKDLTLDDRVWAICKAIELGIEEGAESPELTAAVESARKALEDIPERDPAGRILVWLGRAELLRGDVDSAQRDLADAKGRFVSHSIDDGRAAVLLGRIAESRNQWDQAGQEFQEVVTSHTGTSLWAAARLGRAEVAAMQGDPAGTMKGDYQYAVQAVLEQTTAAVGEGDHGRSGAEMISAGQVKNSLLAQYSRASDAGRLDDALLLLALVQDLKEPEDAALAYRLATTQERRGLELVEEAKKLTGAAAAVKQAEGMKMLADSADAYARHAKLTTMLDEVSGNSLWRAAQLYDLAGKGKKSAQLYEQFTIQRPRDPRVPEGLLAAGRIYQSAGDLDTAIKFYERNIAEHSKTAPSYTSAVNLAQCYVARDPNGFEKAEKVLLSVVQDNPDLQPTAKEFRAALLALGELYYRESVAETARGEEPLPKGEAKKYPRPGHIRWADAILRLEEVLERYPDDEAAARTTFMLAESYRSSAAEIRAAIEADAGIEHRDMLESARIRRIERAMRLYSQVIAMLDPSPESGGTIEDESRLPQLERHCMRASYLNRAQCAYALGHYAEAIRLYDTVATRFSQETLAIEAYVQIVNSYMALGQPAQASAAAERARWILKRIPDEAFASGPAGITRAHYDELLKLGKLQ